MIVLKEQRSAGRRHSIGWVTGLLLSSLLVSCPGERPAYRLGGVLPAPVTPGDAVIAFGLLPKDAVLTLDGVLLPSVRVPNGVQFKVPVDIVAGDHALEVNGDGVRLAGVVTVNPRLDAVALEGASLRMSGAGWVTTGSVTTTKVLVDGVRLTPSRDGAGLRVALPVRGVYGTLRVVVQVGDRFSEPRGVQLEAGAARGRVVFPVPVPAQVLVRGQAVSDLQSSSGLLVHAKASELQSLHLEGVSSMRFASALRVTQLTFTSSVAARNARLRLEALGFVVDLDTVVRIADAGEVRQAPAPRSRLRLQSVTPPVPSLEQWHLLLEGIPAAWTQCSGATRTVAVVDTGVQLEHPDLQPNLLPGYDFVDDDTTPQDIAGHGTHVAGLVAARGQALGVAPDAKILPVRVIRDLSGGSSFTVAQGILWAAGLLEGHPNPHPAQVINLSLGADGVSELIGEAVQRVSRAGVIVIAAAGNSGGGLAFPASMPEAIAVTALAGPKIQYQPWYASRGNGLWVTAFGGDNSQDQDANGTPDGVYSTDLTSSGYGWRNGTSMAAPQVAGLAALALSCGVPSPVVRGLIAGSATDLGPIGFDLSFGHGVISSRLATTPNPRVYAVALEAGSVLGFSPVQTDGTFLLGNLPPSSRVTVFVGTDGDGDGILGEAGDALSSPMPLEPRMAVVSDLSDVPLALTDGQRAFPLEVK
jgi:serine protease